MDVFNEGPHAGEFILSEASGHRSRENVTIGSAQTIVAGTLLALLASVGGVTAAASAGSGNVGNGTIAMASPAVNSKVKNGAYSVIFTDATDFKVEGPDGKEIGTGTSGVAFNKEVKFTITAGATANAAGDVYTIAVGVETPDDLVAVAHDPSADDGSEIASAVAIYGAKTGAGETAKIAAIYRDAEVNVNCLTFAEGITPEDRAAAISSLASHGIIVR